MPKHIDEAGTFDCTGSYDYRNARFSIPVGETLPTIVEANGQLFLLLNSTNSRLCWTVDGAWYYKDAL